MKRKISILLTVVMLLGIAITAAPAGAYAADYSTYKITVDQPSNIIADDEVTVPVTLETDELGEDAYSDYYYEIETISQPSHSNITFTAEDKNDDEVTFQNSGSLNWDEDADLDADFEQEIEWTLVFSKAGDYTVEFRAMHDDETIASHEEDFVVGSDEDENSDVDEDNDEDTEEDSDVTEENPGNTHGLLNALSNHLKERKNGKDMSKANSTLRIMELLQDRGLSEDEIEDAIEAMEDAIAESQGTDEDYSILGKMHGKVGSQHKTYVDGKKVDYEDVEPTVEEGRTLVPIRKIAEALGADVQWIAADKQVVFTKDDITVTITVDEEEATIKKDNNTSTENLDVPASLKNGRVLVPLRFLSEALDSEVDYYPEGAMIVIKTKKL